MAKKEVVKITSEGLRLVTVLNYSCIAELNGFYGKEIYFTDGFQCDIYALFQALGNLGAFARNETIDIDLDYIIISNSILNNPESEKYHLFVIDYEMKLNQSNSTYRRVKLISEDHLIWYLENRAKLTSDPGLINLIKLYKTSTRATKEQTLF
jgi:hypothetical protein